MIGTEYFESEVCSYTLTVRRVLPVLDELSRATRNEVRMGVLRGSDVLTLQPPHHEVTEGVHAEALLHGDRAGACGSLGKSTARLFPIRASSTMSSRPGCPRFTRHGMYHLARRPPPETFSHQVDAGRDITRNEFECGRSAIAMPIFYGRGHVAAAIELTARDLGSELKPAASALSVACRSLSRQLATEFRMMGSRNGHTVRGSKSALASHGRSA